MRKRGRKPGTQLIKNFLNLMKKRGGKTIIYCFTGIEKLPKAS